MSGWSLKIDGIAPSFLHNQPRLESRRGTIIKLKQLLIQVQDAYYYEYLRWPGHNRGL